MTKDQFVQVIRSMPVRSSHVHASYSDVIITFSCESDAIKVETYLSENGIKTLSTVRVSEKCFNVRALIPVKFDAE